ncbi:MAG: class I SAM-dependent methyltransferase [Anaerolineae bacterium]|nr:class I SAM-dependent methyltransferase [Anaerolineae bacterium]
MNSSILQQKGIQRAMLRLPEAKIGSPRFGRRLCKLCDIADWNDPEFIEQSSDIMMRAPGFSSQHRKIWEFTQAVYALKQLGVWNERAVGLSVAGGHERLLYYGTHHLARFVTVDIYGEGDFVSIESDKEFLANPDAFAPYPYHPERLKALYMNALDLKFDDNTFDFVISLSSIEHFGGLEQAIRSLREMQRVVKPGGAVIITTECMLYDQKVVDWFLPEEIAVLVEKSGLSLIEDIDWSLGDETLQYVCDMQRDDLNVTPHINLTIEGKPWTSINLVLVKPHSVSSGIPLLETDPMQLDFQIQHLKPTWQLLLEIQTKIAKLEEQASLLVR